MAKRRKWDVGPSAAEMTMQQVIPPPPIPVSNALDAIRLAQQTAARIAASSVAALPQPQAPTAKDIDLNELTASNRLTLTKKAVIEGIQAKSGTIILVRGRYYPPGAPRGVEPPIHLRVTPTQVHQTTEAKNQALITAERLINEIIAGKATPAPLPPPPPLPPPAPAVPPPMTPSCLITINLPSLPDINELITGPGGSYLTHIVSSSGAQRVELRGKGTGQGPKESQEKPLHIFIAAHHVAAVDAAVNLCLDLLSSVKDRIKENQPHLIDELGQPEVIRFPPLMLPRPQFIPQWGPPPFPPLPQPPVHPPPSLSAPPITQPQPLTGSEAPIGTKRRFQESSEDKNDQTKAPTSFSYASTYAAYYKNLQGDKGGKVLSCWLMTVSLPHFWLSNPSFT